MSHSLGIAIESLVAILLMLTIGYCMLLNKRLQRLKADEHSLKATIAELITATEIAERAIGGLKHTVRDVNENLGSQLTAATQMSAHLKNQLAEGDSVIRRLSRIVLAARPGSEALAAEPAASAVPMLSPARAIAAAAEAFSERRRPVASLHEIVPQHQGHSGRAGRDLRPDGAEDRRPRHHRGIRLRIQSAAEAVVGAGEFQLPRRQPCRCHC